MSGVHPTEYAHGPDWLWCEGEDDENDPPPKACVLCGTQPQSIGLHCNLCYMDLADLDA